MTDLTRFTPFQLHQPEVQKEEGGNRLFQIGDWQYTAIPCPFVSLELLTPVFGC